MITKLIAKASSDLLYPLLIWTVPPETDHLTVSHLVHLSCTQLARGHSTGHQTEVVQDPLTSRQSQVTQDTIRITQLGVRVLQRGRFLRS